MRDHQPFDVTVVVEERPLADRLPGLGVIDDRAVDGDLEEALGVEHPGLLLTTGEGHLQVHRRDAVDLAVARQLHVDTLLRVVQQR